VINIPKVRELISNVFFEKCNEGEIAAMTGILIQGIHGIAEEELNARKNR